MNFIDNKIAEFCMNPNEYFFKLSRYSDQICGSQGFWKAILSESIVALFLASEEQFNALLRGNIECVGFYCVVTGELYMRDSFRYSFHLKDPYAGLPFHYKPIPTYEMTEKLICGMGERLRKPVLPSGFDLSKEETYVFASCDYFDTDGNYQATPGQLGDCVSDSNLVAEIPKFLADPDVWVHTMCEIITQNKVLMNGLVEEMRKKSEIQAICETIRAIPDHPWNRILRFYDAIRGKSTVVVRLQKEDETCDFRLPVERCNGIGHYCMDGSQMPLVFADYCKPINPAGSPVVKNNSNTTTTYKQAKQFLDDSFIYIKDVAAVLYRGNEIYK